MNHLDLNFRFDKIDDQATFEGYASIWGETDNHRDQVERGAFANTLAEHKIAGTKPLMLWSHDQANVIGVWTEIKEDNKGLFVKGKLITSTARGQEAYDLIKAGALNGLSIGFKTIKDKRASNNIRVIQEVYLGEISIVGLPSMGSARILNIRNSGNRDAAAFAEHCKKTARLISKTA